MNLAIIPARSGSTRIRNKNIIDFCGRPMISYPLAAARESGLFDTIHVSTDSSHYAEVVKDIGFEVDFLRDAEHSHNDVGIIEILRWVVRAYESRGLVFDTICMIYATAALIDANDLKHGYDMFVAQDGDIPVLSVTTFPGPVQRALQINDRGVLEPMYPETWPRHSQTLPTGYQDAGGFFIISRERLLADDVKVYTEMLPCPLPRHHAVDIDEPEDLAYAEILYRGRLRTTDGS